MRHGFGEDPALIRIGGSIPPVATFQEVLGIPGLLIGVGLPDDQIHAPNERFDLDQYARGVRVIARLWDELPRALRGKAVSDEGADGLGDAPPPLGASAPRATRPAAGDP
jgi:Peptidase family M20/M25/M40